MYTKRNQRRQFLKLAAGLMAAPLGSMNFAASAQEVSPKPLRFVTIIDHYGVPQATRSDTWVRSSTGDYALQPADLGTILQPLSSYRDNILIASNINLESHIQTRSQRSHHGYTAHVVGASESANTREASARIPHESVDVTIGNHLHSSRSNRVHPHVFFTDYAARNDPTYCYDTSGTLIRSIAGASSGVETLFGSAIAEGLLAETNILAQQDVLQKVSARVQILKTELGNASYNEKLDAYEESVSSLADQLAAQQNQSCELPSNFGSLSSGGADLPLQNRGDILKVVGQLFACDMASSATYAFGGELQSQNRHRFIESGDAEVDALLVRGQHSASHRSDEVASKAHEHVRIHQAELVAEFLDTLSTTTDVDGSPMIDNTVVYLPTAMSHNTHQRSDYALAIIAGANTNLKGGFHYDCGDRTNNDLLVTIAQGLNVPITEHGGFQANGTRVASLNNGPISRMLKSTL